VSKFDTESEESDTGPSGEMKLLDSSDSGCGGIADRQIFALRPGRYRIIASHEESNDRMLLLTDVATRFAVSSLYAKAIDNARHGSLDKI
jgi:hypothetical protein